MPLSPENYEKFARKYRLPEFGELDREFQISNIEKTDFILSEIRENMVDKLETFTDFLSDLLQPDTTVVGMYESRVFPEPKKKEIYAIFKRLMKYKRQSLAAHIENSDRRNADFIREFFGEWAELKPKLLSAVDEVEKSWETESEETEKLGYFG